MNSRNKGVRGELEWRDFLRARGIEAQRGQQHRGGPNSPDVLSALDDRVHWEVKRTECLRFWAAVQQAEGQADPGQIPVVVHRSNRRPWMAILPAEDLIKLLAGRFSEEP